MPAADEIDCVELRSSVMAMAAAGNSSGVSHIVKKDRANNDNSQRS